MDLDPHMETDLLITKKHSIPQAPAAKSELLQNKNRLITMIT